MLVVSIPLINWLFSGYRYYPRRRAGDSAHQITHRNPLIILAGADMVPGIQTLVANYEIQFRQIPLFHHRVRIPGCPDRRKHLAWVGPTRPGIFWIAFLHRYYRHPAGRDCPADPGPGCRPIYRAERIRQSGVFFTGRNRNPSAEWAVGRDKGVAGPHERQFGKTPATSRQVAHTRNRYRAT